MNNQSLHRAEDGRKGENPEDASLIRSIIVRQLDNHDIDNEIGTEQNIVKRELNDMLLEIFPDSVKKELENYPVIRLFSSGSVGSDIKRPDVKADVKSVSNDFDDRLPKSKTDATIEKYEANVPIRITDISDEILYTLHKRHLVSIGLQVNERFVDKCRNGDLPNTHSAIYRSRSQSPCLSRQLSNPLMLEQRRVMMEKIKTNLKSTTNLVSVTPSSSGSMQTVFDFAVYNKLRQFLKQRWLDQSTV